MAVTSESVIKYLFEPRSIAVIGASSDPTKIGYRFVENMMINKYAGNIYPVNPKGGEICGHRAYASIRDVPSDVDVACIMIPAKYVPAAIEDCSEKNVKIACVISAGFSEVGNLAEEKKIVELAHRHGMRILGPNIFGYYSSMASLNATFGPSGIPSGHVAIISQSGALGIAMIGKAQEENIGLSTIVSVGNKADITEVDVLPYLADNPQVKVILIYVEGIKNGEAFVEALRYATPKKPVIILKTGRSKRGAIAAASHTGSLAGVDAVFADVARQCGAIRADTITEALNWCRYFSEVPRPEGENTVIVSNGGGVAVMATDACEVRGVHLLDDPPTMREVFSSFVPDIGSYQNPVDMTGQAGASEYEQAIRNAVKHPKIHAIICLACSHRGFDPDEVANRIARVYQEEDGARKPMAFSFFGGSESSHIMDEFKKKNIPVFADVYDSAAALGALYQHYRYCQTRREDVAQVEIDEGAARAVVERVKKEGRHFLLADESAELMRAAGITIPRSRVARDLSEAVKMAAEVRYPVAMKVVSSDIVHKSDAGGVALNLTKPQEVIDAYERVMANCRAHVPDAKIRGVEIAQMIKPGIEVIVGARIDQSFGPIIMFGAGGIYVEVLKDVAFRAWPVSRGDVREMMKNTRIYTLLQGVRGESARDIGAVEDAILRVGALITRCPGITDIEINPLTVYARERGIVAVDARVLVSV